MNIFENIKKGDFVIYHGNNREYKKPVVRLTKTMIFIDFPRAICTPEDRYEKRYAIRDGHTPGSDPWRNEGWIEPYSEEKWAVYDEKNQLKNLRDSIIIRCKEFGTFTSQEKFTKEQMKKILSFLDENFPEQKKEVTT